MPIAARHRAGVSGEVACPPHVTPDRHRIDEPDGRRVLDLARRRCAPAQGHGRRGAGATRRGRRRRAAGRRRDRPRGHRDPVADRGQAGPLAGEDRRPHRGQGHAASVHRTCRSSWPPARTSGDATTTASARPPWRRERRGPGDGERPARHRARRRSTGAPAAADLVDPAADVPARATVVPPRRAPGRADVDGAPQRHAGDPAARADPGGRAAPARRPASRPPGHRDAEHLGQGGGKPPVAADALLAMADELLPVVRLADWKDRASVAADDGQGLPLRELRAVVAASRTVNLDEEGRAMAKALQESLDQRTTALREEWLARITNALERRAGAAGRRGLHPAARARHPLPGRAGGAAGRRGRGGHDGRPGARGLDAPARRGGGLAGAPDREAGRDPRRRGGQQAARNAAGAVPALAKLLGLRIPPPPAASGQAERRFSPTGG